jgi:capsular polysaccharide biosynthesis protein
MEWIDYRDALFRNLWLIAVLGIAGLTVGLLLPKSALISKSAEQPLYTTITTVGAPPGGGGNSALPPAVTTDQIIYYANSDAVFTQAASMADVNLPTAEVRGMITVLGPCDQCASGGELPGLVAVTVRAPTAVESASLNNAFDVSLGSVIETGAKSLNDGQPVITGFQVLQTTQPDFATATVSVAQKTVNSRTVRVLAGLLIGLVLGLLIALARMLLDKRVTSTRRAQAAIGYPVVAEIPASTSDSREAYRMLWLSVFREPLPDPVERGGGGGDPWLEGVELTSDSGTWPGFES